MRKLPETKHWCVHFGKKITFLGMFGVKCEGLGLNLKGHYCTFEL